MNFATVASGIGAPETAWMPLGWNPVFSAEIEPFPSAVLKVRHNVSNYGDMTKFKEWPNERTVDLICAGTPCQSFSIAGLRKGLDDPRGNLTLTFLAILGRYRPRWVVWENVPGVLSESTGAFGSFLGGLGELGYGFAYRVLDAQYFGVPQRRRRVFVVGHLGDWRRAAAVLFERHSLSGNTPPSREKGKEFAAEVAPSIGASGRGFERAGETRGQDPVIASTISSSPPSRRNGGSYPTPGSFVLAHGQGNAEIVKDGEPSLTCNHEAPICFNSKQDCVSSEDHTGALGFSTPQAEAIAVRTAQTSSNGWGVNTDGQAYTVDQAQGQAVLAPQMTVRRLTPRECERLQGFPDDYTLITYKGKPAADGSRYKALGNSMAVPVMRWIGERIKIMESIK